MNPTHEFLRTLIDNARSGNVVAEQVLRIVCRVAVEYAPQNKLILMAEQLYDFHTDEIRRQVEKN